MSDLFNIISQALGDDARGSMGKELGVDSNMLAQIIPAATALMTGAMAKRAANADGAKSLDGALARDHDGSILGLVGEDMVKASSGGVGEGILKHILGGARGEVEQAVGRETGLDSGKIGKLLVMLAPVILGALGNAKQKQNLAPQDLANVLEGGRRGAEAEAPSGFGGFLGRMLDADGDGSAGDDVARIGMQILGNVMSSRR